MIIRIQEQHSTRRWSVYMDTWQAGFNSREQAESFVRQLKARIEAPHPWPGKVNAGLAQAAT